MKKTDLSKYKNPYRHKVKNVLSVIWYFVNAVFFISHLIPSSTLKIMLLKLFGAKIGRGVVIKPGVNIKYPWRLEVGDFSWIGENVWIDNLEKVTIRANVCISQGAMLLCGNHNYNKISFDLILGEIVIDNGAWVGAKSIVCPGVKLNSHCVLTAGSVAAKDLQSYCIYKGNPAKKIRERVIE